MVHRSVGPEPRDIGTSPRWAPPRQIAIVVVDAFAVRGSAAAAALATDRRFVGCDINQEFVSLPRRRLRRVGMLASCFAATSKARLEIEKKG